MLSVDGILEETNSQCNLNREKSMAGTSSLSNHPASPPIQRLPFDVVYEILLYCLPRYPTIQSAGPIISLLSCVSPTWRTAVRSSPRLWSRLFVTVQLNDDLKSCAQVVTKWFEHARSVSVSFFLNVAFRAKRRDITRIRAFLVDLSPIMLNVRHFGIHAKFTTELLSAFIDLNWKLPLLEKLDLFSDPDFDDGRSVAFFVPIFRRAPNLVWVAVQNAITSEPNFSHVLPWSQLTDVTIIYVISVSRWIEILNLCPTMRSCGVALKGDDEENTHLYPPRKGTHQNLQCLEFELFSGRLSFLELLSFHDFPSLDDLYVFCTQEPVLDFPHPQSISALANLRQFRLNFLAISHGHIAYLTDILREMVNLKMLELEKPTQEFIALYQALSFKQAEKAILPRLSTFAICFGSLDQLPERDEELRPLFDMLTSRCEKDTVPAGYDSLRYFGVQVATDDIHERMKNVFDPWITGLPPHLKLSIKPRGRFRFDMPPGWTYPISELGFL